MTKRNCLFLILWAVPLCAESNSGESRLKLTDPAGGMKSSVQLVSEVKQVRKTWVTDEAGDLVAKLLPSGVYRLAVEREGFAPFSDSTSRRTIRRNHRASREFQPGARAALTFRGRFCRGDLSKKDKRRIRWQADIEHLNNRLNVIGFAGLFSGNAIAPPRSYSLRFTSNF